MKRILYPIVGLFCFLVSGQEAKEIKTKVDEVTVFTDGAQIVRKKQIEIPK